MKAISPLTSLLCSQFERITLHNSSRTHLTLHASQFMSYISPLTPRISRLTPHFSPLTSHVSPYSQFERIAQHVHTFTSLLPVSFVLGFYVSLVVSRWWGMYSAMPWPDSLCILLGVHLQGNVRPEVDG